MIPVPDEWETVAREPLEVFAILKRDLLHNEGIEAVLRGNKASNTAGAINELNISWNNPLGGVEVRVHRDNAQHAREILEAHESRAERGGEHEGFDERDTSGELGMEKWGRFARYGALFFVSLWILPMLFWLFTVLRGHS